MAEPGAVGLGDHRLDHRGARSAVDPGAERGGVGFDHTAGPLAIDDVHDDGPGLGHAELGDDRDPGTVRFVLLAGGGLLFSTGAVVYARQRPDPVPSVFGYHEVFHALVIAAVALHFGLITSLAR